MRRWNFLALSFCFSSLWPRHACALLSLLLLLPLALAVLCHALEHAVLQGKVVIELRVERGFWGQGDAREGERKGAGKVTGRPDGAAPEPATAASDCWECRCRFRSGAAGNGRKEAKGSEGGGEKENRRYNVAAVG